MKILKWQIKKGKTFLGHFACLYYRVKLYECVCAWALVRMCVTPFLCIIYGLSFSLGDFPPPPWIDVVCMVVFFLWNISSDKFSPRFCHHLAGELLTSILLSLYWLGNKCVFHTIVHIIDDFEIREVDGFCPEEPQRRLNAHWKACKFFVLIPPLPRR